MNRRASNNGLLVLALSVLAMTCSKAAGFADGFEAGWGDWSADVAGVWEIGPPTSGPNEAHEGLAVAATILDGNYDADTDSRLISPLIELPDVSEGERIELRFWQWYSYDMGDRGQVHISQWTGSDWGSWVALATVAAPENALQGSGWSRTGVDLTACGGSQVRVAFYHEAGDWWNKGGLMLAPGGTLMRLISGTVSAPGTVSLKVLRMVGATGIRMLEYGRWVNPTLVPARLLRVWPLRRRYWVVITMWAQTAG